jgi:hypothetical protein
VHDEPSPLLRLPAIFKIFSTVKTFYGVEPSTPSPTPDLEGQGIPCCLDHHLGPVRHGRPYQKLRYRQHSSQNHMTTRAPALRQSRDTYGGTDYIKYFYNKKRREENFCWLSGSHSGGYLLEYNVVEFVESKPTCPYYMSPPSAGSKK